MTDTEKKSWTVQMEEGENGDLLLPFPPDLLNQMGWAEGTELWWDITKDGNLTLQDKKPDESK